MSKPALHSDGQLIIRQDLRIIAKTELSDRSLTIGRSSSCDITLNHEAVSRLHARVEWRGRHLHVIDTDSVNGVHVNGRQVHEAHLMPGDVIEIRPFAINYTSRDTDQGDRSLQLGDSRVACTITRENRSMEAGVKQRLEDLYTLSRLVLRRKDDGSFWLSVHAALQRSLIANRCILVGVDEAAGYYRLAPSTRGSEINAPLGISRSVLNEVVGSGQGLLIQHVAQDERFAGRESLVGGAVGSVLCVPLVVGGRTRAVVYSDRQVNRLPFGPDDLNFAIAAMDLASAAVDLDELQVRAQELSRIRGRIDAAREMQEMMLPSPIPQPTWGQVSAVNYPADRMSGDVYDIAIDAKGRLLISIADVSGKGVPAAFATAILQNSFRSSLNHLEDLKEIVQQINKTFDAQSPSGCFATMVICRWSPTGDLVQIANAGHHAPLWWQPCEGVTPFPERIGLPLGVHTNWTGEIVVRNTPDNTLVLLSSDGITEARNLAGQEYELSRLAEQLGRLHTKHPDVIITGVLENVRAFCSPAELIDDATLLVVKCTRGEHSV